MMRWGSRKSGSSRTDTPRVKSRPGAWTNESQTATCRSEHVKARSSHQCQMCSPGPELLVGSKLTGPASEQTPLQWLPPFQPSMAGPSGQKRQHSVEGNMQPHEEEEEQHEEEEEEQHGGQQGMSKVGRGIIGAAVGVGLALVGIPLGIFALGFTASGIAAGSIAAKMMSAAAIANGGGVAAGSLVSVLQSVGAAGFSTATQVGLASTLGTVGGAVGVASTPKPQGGKKPKK